MASVEMVQGNYRDVLAPTDLAISNNQEVALKIELASCG